jgi:hypothetical protein
MFLGDALNLHSAHTRSAAEDDAQYMATQYATSDDRMCNRNLTSSRSGEHLDDRSHASTPAAGSDHVDRVDTRTHSLPDDSEVQFGQTALERARQAGWDSQRNTVRRAPLMTSADISRSTAHPSG